MHFHRGPVVSRVATQFLDRASGLTSQRSYLYTRLIDGLVQDGVWSKLDALWIGATDTQAHALLNVKSARFPLAVVGSPTFTADRGFAGGASAALTTGFIPSTAGGVYTQNSASFGFYNRTNSTANDSQVAMGLENFMFVVPNQGGLTYFDINDGNFPNIAAVNHQGMFVLSRVAASGAGAVNLYRNSNTTPIGTSTGASSALTGNEVWLLCSNGFGSQLRNTTDQIAAWFIGSALTSAEAGNISSRINTYMTAVGANVY